MKFIYIILLLLTFISCKDDHERMHEEMDKVSNEFRKFDIQLIKLYKKSENNPKEVISIIDSFLVANKKETDKYKSQIKSNIESSLHYFKAELFYKTGEYNKSISELNFNKYRKGNIAIAYASNYVKLKDFKTAKSFIDSIGNWNGNYYALGNYYESIGDKISALKTYKYNLEEDKSRKHFIYYVWTQKRVEELEKNKPLLNDIFFPTGNPSFEICEICNIDNAKRVKITDLLVELPESRGWTATTIVESPYDTGKDYYWIRVDIENRELNYRELNYFVDQKTFEIKYFNPKTKTVVTLENWRKGK